MKLGFGQSKLGHREEEGTKEVVRGKALVDVCGVEGFMVKHIQFRLRSMRERDTRGVAGIA